jgi:hypothetical protein
MARVCPAGLWGAIVMEGVTILGIDTQTVVSGACLPESESVCFRLQDIACDTVWHAHLMRHGLARTFDAIFSIYAKAVAVCDKQR